MFFPEEAKVGVKTIKTYVDRMKTENVHRAILVVQQNLTPFARQCVSEMSSKYHLEVFQVRPTQRCPFRISTVRVVRAAMRLRLSAASYLKNLFVVGR